MKQKSILSFFLSLSLLLSFSRSCAVNKGIVYFLDNTGGRTFTKENVWGQLREALRRLGYAFKCTQSMRGLGDCARIICNQVASSEVCQKLYPKEKLIRFIWEPPVVSPREYDKDYHKYFGKVYTWMDDLVDNKKYFKIYWHMGSFAMIKDSVSFKEKKLCVMVNANKDSRHPKSLYGERRNVIKFFERNFCDDFDLYGYRWLSASFKNYKGTVASKIDCLKHYKFCFAYENMRDVGGWVSEKIFDPFKAGCVPIYWGARNITKYVPKSCFVDRRDFKSNEQLYYYLKNMSEEEYQEYIDNIRVFFSSAQSLLWSHECYIDTVLNAIEPGYDKTIVLTEQQRSVVERAHNYLKKN